MHNVMGGALPTASSTTQRGRTGVVSRHHPQAATIATSRGGGERDRASKRRLESRPNVDRERRSEEGGLYDASGLSKSQRLSAFLSTSSEPVAGAGNLSILSTGSAASARTQQEPPVKKKALEQPKERRTDTDIAMAQQDSASAEKIPVPEEGYFPIHQQLPPLQVG